MLWRERRWRTIIDLLESLPPASRTISALANDKDYARAVVAAHEPSGAEFSSLEEETRLVTAILDLYDLVAVTFGQKARAVRPKTQLDVERKRAQERAAMSLISQVAPWAFQEIE